MATTTRYGFTVPTVGSDTNTWGAELNGDLNSIDSFLYLTALGNIGAVAPTVPTPAAGMIWIDNTTPSATVWNVQMYDGNNWVVMGTLDSVAHEYSPSNQINPTLDGQVIIGATSGSPVAATLTAGDGIDVTNGANSITIGLSTPVSSNNGGTGVDNGGNTLTLAGSLITSGANSLTLTTTGVTNVTLPTTGTLVNDTVTTLANLSSIGTVTSGTWQGSVVSPTYGGTGVNNSSNTLTLAGNLATSGANALTLTTTGSTNVTLPTTGTLVNSAVTTLSSLNSVGTIGTGVWNATVVSPTYGGTGVSNPTNHGILVGQGAGAISPKVLTNGQLLIGSTGNDPVAATLTAGTNVTITPGAGTITIAASGGGGGGGFTSVIQRVFTASGTYTPTTGMAYCWVRQVSGGGGGGGASLTASLTSSAGGGGGGGGYAEGVFSAATIGASQTVTIGTAGTAGSGGGTGGNGGATSFGSLLVTSGGSGGNGSGAGGASYGPGSGGGTATVGTLTVPGGRGGNGFSYFIGSLVLANGGAGGSTVFGAGGNSALSVSGGGGAANTGYSAVGYGGGGSGGTAANGGGPSLGGAGTAGYVIVTEYII